nr:secretory phospholipase A2 receptor-like; partial [Biomphalaria glabrata]
MTTNFINCLSHLLVFLGVVSSDSTFLPPFKTPAAPTCTDRGWIDHVGYCYYVSSDKANWITAQDVCRNKGAELVSVHSDDENNFLLTLSDKGYWIGLKKISKDNYRWSDGSTVDYIARNYYLVTTNDFNQCVIIRSPSGSSSGQEQWLLSSCHDSFNYICKFQINLHQTTPLINIIRYVCPDKFSGREESGKCFYIGGLANQARLTWDAAKEACSKMSSQRVVQITSIKNANEQAYLSSLINGYSVDAWIGLKSYDTQQLPNTWQDKSPVNYTNWYRYLIYDGFLSSFSTDGEFCAYSSFRDSGLWILDHCRSKKAYICETEKVPLVSTKTTVIERESTRIETSVQHGKVYYMIIEQLVVWSEAHLLCQQHVVDSEDTPTA